MEESVKKSLIETAMIVISGDMFQKVYDLSDYLGWIETVNIIKRWSREFVDKLIEIGYEDNEDIDFIIELEKFEENKFNDFKKMY